MSTLAEKYQEFVIPTYGRFDLDIARGSGCRVWDFEGREFLDFGAGIAVCSLGHAHPEVTAAISAQAAKLVHTSNLYRTAPQAALAERLVGITGPGKVFFCNSGAEANEGLIKLARRFGSATGRHEILTFEGSFHGRTMAGISATGQQKVKTGFGPLLDGFRHLPFGDLDAVAGAIGPSTVAILVEPVQGEGGIHIAREAFLTGLRKLCDQHDLLLLFDEIQCGLGRTGEWCGWKSLAPQVQPDGVSWAKGIANGFPLGAFWVGNGQRDDRGPLCDLLGPGSHGTTYGGNPVACMAGLKVLEIIERDNLRAAAVRLGHHLVSALHDARIPHVTEVRSIGLMVGIQLDRESFPKGGTSPLSAIGDGRQGSTGVSPVWGAAPDARACAQTGGTPVLPLLHFSEMRPPQGPRPPALEAVIRSMDKGLLAIPAGETVVRFLPPLNVTADEIEEAVKKFAAAIASLEDGSKPAPIQHT